ncbi:hypothetical protein [Pandoraea pulmonicola]|uniref:Uncharacterized protein n=1 Tax=Pandoraea pulmonicola TaxID=93221 RepID=A0AAJ4Z958_PANPU|nr:hypothetical protein [Pandoraea pulmonicola]AJC21971.1 hypothetical protein RO07_18435 [Pandoraea pulmonicola]SUA89068.1 Uncharacterised protein [Pandoraea pulmonicola]
MTVRNDALREFANEQLNIAARTIENKGDKMDKVAAGKIEFFLALRSVLSGEVEKRELGLIDAVNDTLQFIKLIGDKETFYKSPQT